MRITYDTTKLEEKRMRRRLVIPILAAGILATTGCQRNQGIIEDTTTEETTEEENPFEKESFEQQGVNVDKMYSWGIENYDARKCEIDLEKNEITLELEFSNQSDSFQTGILVFIDGIAQEYEVEGQKGYVVPVTVEGNQEEEVSTKVQLKIKPKFFLEGEKHILYIGSLCDPEFRVENANASYGNHLKMSIQNAWTINGTGEVNRVEVSNKTEQEELLKSIKSRYIKEGVDGKTENRLEQQFVTLVIQNNKELPESSAIQGEVAYFYGVGGTCKKYRVCCMVNHEPYPAFDGKCYADMDITTDSMTKVKMDFSKKTYGKNSCMYLLLCPYDENGQVQDNFMWNKTESYTLE